MGKDFSTVSMPIALNEPLNLLQKLAEELEYSELLDAANAEVDPITRILLVSGSFSCFIINFYQLNLNF
jgi:oxysterol-binding protein-related protein 3/6/7